MTGTTLGSYRILEELGRGGMGIVYLAEDTKLERRVALKVLPAAALASQDDRARFYREAKAAAALNHPNIAQIYQIDEAVPEGSPTEDSRPFIAMEFIDGETLDARIKRGPLKLEEALRIASEATDALKLAHEKGIVHRDVKSANIMLDAGGRAKVLDFGLAQTSASTKLTRMGSTLGTVAYMSPEQARGEEVDHRTDLWALGVILYEMVAGRHPFAGDYEQAVVYSILNEGVEPLTGLRTGVPMSLEWIVSKCLAKAAKDRYQSAGDLLVDLRNVDLQQPSVLRSTSTRSSMPAVAPARRGPDWKMVAVGLVLGLLLVGVPWLLSGTTAPPEMRAVRSQIVLPGGLTFESGKSAPLNIDRTNFDLSRDGQWLVVVGSRGGTTGLYGRRMDSDRFEFLTGTEGAYAVAISPDGSRAAFYANNLLKTVALQGGSPRDIAPVSLPYNMLWLSDGRILFENDEGSSIEIIDADGQNRKSLRFANADVPGQMLSSLPSPIHELPDGKVLAWSATGTWELDLDQELARLVDEHFYRTMHGNGASIFLDGSGLSLVGWDDGAARPEGLSVTLTDSLYQRSSTNALLFQTDDQGTLLFMKGPDFSRLGFHWLGSGEPVPVAGLSEERYLAFRISPDGKSLLVPIGSVDGHSIWAIDLERNVRTNLSGPGNLNYPVWTPDGSEAFWGVYDGKEYVVVKRAINSSAAPDTLVRGNVLPEWITPDGRYLGVIKDFGSGQGDVMMVDLENPSTLIPIANQPDVTELLARLSPSGRFVAYTSTQTGDYQVFVQPIPPTGRSWQVSVEGGEEPLWSADEGIIYWRNGDRLMRASVIYAGDTPSFGRPETVFEGQFENVNGYSIDISPLDGRILMLRNEGDRQGINRLEMVTNYPALLDRE